MSTFIAFVCVAAALASVATVAYLSFVSANYNGWRELAETYRLKVRKPRRRRSFLSATLNEYSFPGNWSLGVSEEGLFLKLIGLGWLFHPPLLVPWKKLRVEPYSNPFARGVKLTIPNERFELEISEKTRTALLKLVEPEWTAARSVLSAGAESPQAEAEGDLEAAERGSPRPRMT
ncbi:MAG: hypothetical protein AAF725_17655 [Acidobacteriota bacterium]